MIDLKTTQAICPWCVGLTDKSLWPWLREKFTLIEVLSHVGDAKRLGGHSYTGIAEFFGGGNWGLSVGQQIRTAGEECGLYSIVNVDNHHGNGRFTDALGESTATGTGKYHSIPSTEGGFTHWLNSFLKWGEEILQWVVAIQLTNETRATPASNAWAVQFLTNNAHRIRARGWLIIVDQHQARALKRANVTGLFDIIDPHIFNREPAWTQQFIAGLRIEFPGKLIWVTEQLDPHSHHTYEMAKAILAGGGKGVSAFSGCTNQPLFYEDDWFQWNGRRRSKPAAACFSDTGITTRGREWERLIAELGIGGGQPVEPPVEPPLKPINVDAAVRKIHREVLGPSLGWTRSRHGTFGLPFGPTKTVGRILDDLGQPWES